MCYSGEEVMRKNVEGVGEVFNGVKLEGYDGGFDSF